MKKYGCHCDLEEGVNPDDCVIDLGRKDDCVYARNGIKKEECPYWKEYDDGEIATNHGRCCLCKWWEQHNAYSGECCQVTLRRLGSWHDHFKCGPQFGCVHWEVAK